MGDSIHKPYTPVRLGDWQRAMATLRGEIDWYLGMLMDPGHTYNDYLRAKAACANALKAVATALHVEDAGGES